jgi:membrane-bound lytic murein transglycosylase D
VISFFEADTVLVDRKISLRDVASATDIPYDLLAYLNPIYKKGVIPDGEESYSLRLPVNKVNAFIANSDKIFTVDPSTFVLDDSSLDNPLDYIAKTIKIYHTVKRGERLAMIADNYNCTVTEIKKWNKIKGKSVYRGQRLAIYTTVKQRSGASTEAKRTVADSTLVAKTDSAAVDTVKTVALKTEKKKAINASKFVWHVVQRGDTLWNIAQRYNGNVKDIRTINKLKTSALKPGTKLKIKVAA